MYHLPSAYERLSTMDIAGPNSLIRLLRSPQDPSQQNGLSKIAIAQRVWSTSADIPGKADIIRDWIYSVWEKDGKGCVLAYRQVSLRWQVSYEGVVRH